MIWQLELIVDDKHVPQWKARPLNTRDSWTCKICLFSGLRAAPHIRQQTQVGTPDTWWADKQARLQVPPDPAKEKGALAMCGDSSRGSRLASQQTSTPANRQRLYTRVPPSRLTSEGLPACYSPSRHLPFSPLMVPMANNDSLTQH